MVPSGMNDTFVVNTRLKQLIIVVFKVIIFFWPLYSWEFKVIEILNPLSHVVLPLWFLYLVLSFNFFYFKPKKKFFNFMKFLFSCKNRTLDPYFPHCIVTHCRVVAFSNMINIFQFLNFFRNKLYFINTLNILYLYLRMIFEKCRRAQGHIYHVAQCQGPGVGW